MPLMRLCFIHQNLPGQFRHLIKALSDDPTNEVWAIVAIGLSNVLDTSMSGSILFRVQCLQVRRGQAVANALLKLKTSGLTPNLIVVHEQRRLWRAVRAAAQERIER